MQISPLDGPQFNKLRKYRAQVVSLELALKDQKEQASSAKHQTADYNNELQHKLHSLREERKNWMNEAADLRKKEKEARNLFSAQKKLLEEASRELFQLQTQKKETQHKIDRLKDYERRIDQHIKIQRLWDEDFRKFNGREEQMQEIASEYKKMELRLESYDKTQADLRETALRHKREARSLEVALKRKESAGLSRRVAEAEIKTCAAANTTLSIANTQLREQNEELMEEIEELNSMVEHLRAQVSGRKGVVSEPRSSPILSSTENLRGAPAI